MTVDASPRPSYDELASLTEPRLVTDVPGPQARLVIERDERITSPSLPRAYPFAPQRGAGAVVEDVDGNAFLDLNAAIAVCSTGHAHPEVTAAIKDQAERLLHYSASDFYLPIYSELCERLAEIAPMSPTRIFLSNSGTEAVEAAMKLARHHTGRQYILSFYGSFHGRSYGSVSLTASKATYRAGFGPLLPGVVHAPYADSFDSYRNLEEPDAPGYIEKVLFKRILKPDEIAAVVVEPVLGEGGYVVPPAQWIQKLRAMCDEHGMLLVVDEIQSGMGRTGKMWAIEHFGVEPDIVLAGKGIASGMPLGAMIARKDVMSWGPGTHGSTYGGNPVSCAAALASIDLITTKLADNAEEVGRGMLEVLREISSRYSFITDVRGLGLMIGVELDTAETADAVEKEALRRGVLLLQAGDSTLRMAPPLVITSEQAATALRIFDESCAEVAARAA
jgi:4-aminobutyrate aminotransferase